MQLELLQRLRLFLLLVCGAVWLLVGWKARGATVYKDVRPRVSHSVATQAAWDAMGVQFVRRVDGGAEMTQSVIYRSPAWQQFTLGYDDGQTRSVQCWVRRTVSGQVLNGPSVSVTVGAAWVTASYVDLAWPEVPASYSKHSWSQTVQNTTTMAQQYTFTLQRPGESPYTETVLVQPGQSYTWNVEGDTTFTPTVTYNAPLPDGMGFGNQDVTVGGPVETTVSNPPENTQSGTPEAGNVWDTGADEVFGNQDPAQTTTQGRASDYSSTTAAVQTLDTNENNRWAELRSLMESMDARQRERAQMQMVQQAQIATMLGAHLAGIGAGIKELLPGLTEEVGTGPIGTDAEFGGLVGEGLGEAPATWFPVLDVGQTEAPVFNIPLSAVGSIAGVSMEDASIDFSDPSWEWYVSGMRSFLVGCISLMALFGFSRLLSSTFGIHAEADMQIVLRGFLWALERLGGVLADVLAKIALLGETVLGGLMLAVSTALPEVDPAAISDVLGQANYLFPVSESVGLLTLYGGLWALCVGYRAVKSWIPTVSG